MNNIKNRGGEEKRSFSFPDMEIRKNSLPECCYDTDVVSSTMYMAFIAFNFA